MHLLNVTQLPIYLPGDAAFTPFGDPMVGTVTNGGGTAPGVATVPGYVATAGDSFVLSTAGGAIPGGLAANTEYYVVTPVGDTFEISATKGGAAINTTSTGSALTFHFTSGDAGIQNIRLPFKPGNRVVALNMSAGALTLQGASDTGAGYGEPQGPGAWTAIATIAADSAGELNLSYDWISLSAAGTLALLQH